MALLGLVAGLLLGSFIAALTLRWPAGRSIVRASSTAGGSIHFARSQCDSCGTTLTARDLVPVFSFSLLRGRCRHCAAAIAPRHLWIELAAAGIGALALGLHPGLPGIAGALFGWGLLALAILDAEHFWLPDRLVLPLLVSGLLAAAWLAPPLPERLIGAASGYASLALIALAYHAATGRKGLGGGDPKLFAAIGAWLGWQLLPFVLLLAATLGLLLAAIHAARGRAIGRQTRVPLGALLAIAAWPLWLLLPAGLSSTAPLAMRFP